jgi:transcriptional regulator with XRE-family HTH domain
MDNKAIKQRIEKRRKELALSQSEIAKILDVSQTAYHKIEKGDTALVSDRVEQLSEILKMSEEELIFGYHIKTTLSESSSLLEEKDRRIAELENIIKDKSRIIDLLLDKMGTK